MLRINFNHNCVRRLNQPQTDISKPWPLDSSQRARFLAMKRDDFWPLADLVMVSLRRSHFMHTMGDNIG